MTTARTIFLTALLVLTAATGGCQIVRVTDSAGDPLFWAAVTVAERGEEPSWPAYTDPFGNAVIMDEWDEEEMSEQFVEASKDGYRSRKVRRSPGTIDIQLMKAPGE